MGAYRVTRLNGAPPRRAGRAWAEGETLVSDLAAEQVAAIGADPRYRIGLAWAEGETLASDLTAEQVAAIGLAPMAEERVSSIEEDAFSSPPARRPRATNARKP